MDKEMRNVHGDNVLTEAEAAYFAGFVDGEGTITIARSKQIDRRSGWKYQPVFSVANSDLTPLLWLRDKCGNGWIKSNFHKKARVYHRTVYQLRLTAHQIRHVLPQIEPFLICKKRQAQLLLAFLAFTKKGDGAAKSDKYWNTLEQYRVDLSNLNPRGLVPMKTPEVLDLRASRQGVNQFTKSRESA